MFRNTGMQILCGGILLIMIATMILFMSGKETLASAISTFGTLLWILGVLIYVMVFDSKKRWPNDSLGERITKIMTFTR